MKLIMERWNQFLLTERKDVVEDAKQIFGKGVTITPSGGKYRYTNTGIDWAPSPLIVEPDEDAEKTGKNWKDLILNNKLKKRFVEFFEVKKLKKFPKESLEEAKFRYVDNFISEIVYAIPKDTALNPEKDRHNQGIAFLWMIKIFKSLSPRNDLEKWEASIKEIKALDAGGDSLLSKALETFFSKKKYLKGEDVKYTDINRVESFAMLKTLAEKAELAAPLNKIDPQSPTVTKQTEVLAGAISVFKNELSNDRKLAVDIIYPGEEAKIKFYEEKPEYVLDRSAMKQPGAGNWLILALHGKEASCAHGADTKWCTANTPPQTNYFNNYYEEDSPLFFFKELSTGRKFQLQYSSEEFMDENDHSIPGNLLYELHMLLKNNKRAREYERTINNNDRTIVMRAAQHPNTRPDQLDQLITDRDTNVQKVVVRNPNLNLNTMVELASSDNLYLRGALADNPNITPEILSKLADDSEFVVRYIAVRNKNMPASSLRKLASDDSYRIRAKVAIHPNTEKDVLTLLSTDEHDSPRAGAAKNPNTPIDVLDRLSDDPDKLVRRYAESNPAWASADDEGPPRPLDESRKKQNKSILMKMRIKK